MRDDAWLKAIVQVRASVRKDGTQVRAHTRTVADTAAIVQGLARRLKRGEASAHETAASALTLARHASKVNQQPAHVFRHPAGHWVVSHNDAHVPTRHHQLVARKGKAWLRRPGRPDRPVPEGPDEVRPLEGAPAPHVHRELVGKGSTGEVYREGQEVVKAARVEADGGSAEGKVYAELAGTPGIAAGRQEGAHIRMPWYPKIVSVDAVAPADREGLAEAIRPNVARINAAVAALSARGYYYADPLQFGMKDGHLDLLDFSNATVKPVKDATHDNATLLSLFYREFGLPDEAKKVSAASHALRSMRYFHKNRDKEVHGLFEQVHGEGVAGQQRRILAEMGGAAPDHVYYADRAPAGLPPGASHVEVKGHHVVFSGHRLAPGEVARHGLTPLVHAPGD